MSECQKMKLEHDENTMDSSSSDNEDEDITGNPGWADAMAKVLQMKKPKKSKSIVLSRAKKLNEISKSKEQEPEDTKDKEELIKRNKKKEFQSKFRVKPNVLERVHERKLNRIATRGVVQLFNAVKQHQKALKADLEKAGGSERKREKVMKTMDKQSFLKVLMGTEPSESVKNVVKEEPEGPDDKEENDKPTWEVLRDDFMMDAKRLKDWDKQDNQT